MFVKCDFQICLDLQFPTWPPHHCFYCLMFWKLVPVDNLHERPPSDAHPYFYPQEASLRKSPSGLHTRNSVSVHNNGFAKHRSDQVF